MQPIACQADHCQQPRRPPRQGSDADRQIAHQARVRTTLSGKDVVGLAGPEANNADGGAVLGNDRRPDMPRAIPFRGVVEPRILQVTKRSGVQPDGPAKRYPIDYPMSPRRSLAVLFLEVSH